MKVLIAAGGTGGHVNPALAVAGEKKVLLLQDKEKIHKLLSDEKVEKFTFDSKPLFAYADKNGFEIKKLDFFAIM